MEISKEQLAKIFELAGLKDQEGLLSNASPDDITRALISIEEKQASDNEESTTQEHYAKVLIVDDLELSTFKLSLMLKKINIFPVVAHTKQEALSQLKKQRFDFVFVDLFLPDEEDGLAVMNYANQLRTEGDKDFKIIAISGTDDLNLVTGCFNAGIDEFISKTAKWHEQILKIIVDKSDNASRKNFVRYDTSENTSIFNVKSFSKKEYVDELLYNAKSLIISGTKNLILNLENIQTMSQEFAGIFTELYKQCSDVGGKLIILKPSDSVKDVLEFSCLSDVITVVETSEQAFDALNG